MQIMYCYIEPFIMNQNVFVGKDKGELEFLGKVKIEDMPEYFTTTYQNENIDKIILNGPAKDYIKEISNSVKEYAVTKYNLKDIKIEVIK